MLPARGLRQKSRVPPQAEFTGAVAALALATGLAFGMGGRDLANRKLDDWYETGSNKAERLK